MNPTRLSDEEREARIQQLGNSMVTETTLVERARMWREMRELIAGLIKERT